MRAALVPLLLALLAPATDAARAQDCQAIDFESIPGGAAASEGTAISTQFQADFGVSFSLEGGGSPELAEAGSPLWAYTGFGGAADTPAPPSSQPLGNDFGSVVLTIEGGTFLPPPALLVSYAAPVAEAAGFILDIDQAEAWTLEARDADESVLDTRTLTPLDPGAGNALGTRFTFSRPSAEISSLRISYTGTTSSGIGLAFDEFSPSCIAAGPRLRVSQESAPAQGDFDENVLGCVEAFRGASDVAGFYAYDTSQPSRFGGPTPLLDDTTQLLFFEGTDGLSLVALHDRGGDPDGGSIDVSYSVSGDPDDWVRLVSDDPGSPDVYTPAGVGPSATFAASQTWSSAGADGIALGTLEGSWVALVDVQSSSGWSQIQATSADGASLVLSPAASRRVRLDPCPEPVPSVPSLSGLAGLATLALLLVSALLLIPEGLRAGSRA